METTRALTYWSDLEASRKGKQPLAANDDTQVVALRREKEAWQAQCERECMKRKSAEESARDWEEKAKSTQFLLNKAWAHEKKLSEQHKQDLVEVQIIRDTLKTKERELEGKEREFHAQLLHSQEDARKAREEAAKASEEAVQAFLGSRAFKAAAMVSMTQLVRGTIYDELDKLGTAFPFRPEQLGFTRVSSKDALPQNLAGYSWDRTNDILLGPGNTPVNTDIQLETCDPSELIYVWPQTQWPDDCTKPPEASPPRAYAPDQVPSTPGQGLSSSSSEDGTTRDETSSEPGDSSQQGGGSQDSRPNEEE